uniref:RSE1/DDB1/CPSF1 first beta-propeller domain-containing protein n=1 Tax=Phlebotomus papatasi TaxID=29031 RepID=A0A1B0DKC2_PHLPP
MYLYNLTLQKATGITHAVHGSFSGQKIQEILISRGKSLELLRPDPNTGKIHTLLTTEVFGVIRSLIAFRLTGGTKEYRGKGGLCVFPRADKRLYRISDSS